MKAPPPLVYGFSPEFDAWSDDDYRHHIVLLVNRETGDQILAFDNDNIHGDPEGELEGIKCAFNACGVVYDEVEDIMLTSTHHAHQYTQSELKNKIAILCNLPIDND